MKKNRSADISEKLTLLSQATLDSLDLANLKNIISHFSRAALKILDGDYSIGWYRTQNVKKYQLAFSSPKLPFTPQPPRHNGLRSKVESKQKAYFASKIGNSIAFRKNLLPFIKSFVIIPISYKNHTYGNIVLFFKKFHAFAKEERSLCVSLGQSAAQAITIHQLYFNLKDFKNRLDKTLDSVFIFDATTFKIEYANLGAAHQLGYTNSEICKKTILDIQPFIDAAKFRKFTAPLVWKRKDSLTVETVLKTKNGRNIPVELFIQLSGSLGGPRKFLSIVHDLTERKKVEQESQRLLKQKDEFFGVASHELKTPVTTIKGFAQMLTERLAGSDQQAGYFLGKINSQIEKLNHLINDLLDVSRIETGKLKFETREFELSQVAQNLVENFQLITASHKISYTSEGEFWIDGDIERIEQVIINLLNNAIKYSPPDTEILVSLKADDSRARLEVEDFGFGISKKDSKKIFNRFFQSKKRGKSAYPGLGLGLYISQTIIKHHGGELNLTNKKTQGTIFYFTVPYKRCQIEPQKNS